jgi:hypothetical protein
MPKIIFDTYLYYYFAVSADEGRRSAKPVLPPIPHGESNFRKPAGLDGRKD